MKSIISRISKWYGLWKGSIRLICADMLYLFLQRRYLSLQIKVILYQLRALDAQIKYHRLKGQQSLGELPVFGFVSEFYNKVNDVFDSTHKLEKSLN